MSLIPWRKKSKEPIAENAHPIQHFRSEIDRVFDRFFTEPWGALAESFGATEALSPVVDIKETEKNVEVRAEIPGVDPKDLELSLSENVLTMRGEKKSETKKKEHGSVLSECSYGSFTRRIALPCDVDTEDVDAEHKNGVLTVKLKKSHETPVKQIEIKAN